MSLSDSGLNGYSILALIIFALVMLFVIRPTRIPLPGFVSRQLLNLTRAALPQSLKNWLPRGRMHIHLNLSTAPGLGVLILLVSRAITFSDEIRLGIVGSDGVKPFSIMILFLSLAYVSLSLDSTGLFRAAAFWVMQKAAKRETNISLQRSERGPPKEDQIVVQRRVNGTILFSALYTLFFVLSAVVGNDPAILTGTAFLSYLVRVADLNPRQTFAWTLSEFWAANTGSMVLVVGNLTNLVVANAYNTNFAVYSAFMILPALAAVATGLCVLLVQFKFIPRFKSCADERHICGQHDRDGVHADPCDRGSYIPRILNVPSVKASGLITDKSRAMFGCILLSCTLAALIATSFFEVDVWIVTLPCALVMLGRDIIGDILRARTSKVSLKPNGVSNGSANTSSKRSTSSPQVESRTKHLTNEEDQPQLPSLNSPEPTAQLSQRRSRFNETMGETDSARVDHSPQITGSVADTVPAKEEEAKTLELARELPNSHRPSAGQNVPDAKVAQTETHLPLVHRVQQICPTVMSVGAKLPYTLVPFTFCMFILVQSLQSLGWVAVFARWLVIVANGAPGDGVAGTIFFVGVMSVLLCNVAGTNIGATILIARIFQDKAFSGPGGPGFPGRLGGKGNRLLNGSLYALAYGSNVGAFSLSISASLAGLLWESLLKQKSIMVRRREFLKWNLVGILLTTLIGIAVIFIEVTIVY